ncbi:S9 family peptidase [Qipengyuania xiapuensis]|uniref:S9 family peptidase n=1 Tax=Qipengyuania xiapuensis TaxID=2867236 RepID=A0ABX8ZXR0_9SPHN|nr:S9 family peptidase [Qipengyuania xiapuensis]QZD92899.1 S9 family peptidase [Qipengyuania xiapuensis]
MKTKTFALIGAKLGMLAATGAIALAAVPANTQTPAALPIEAYGALPALEEAVISRSGAYTAMLMTANNQRQILVVDSSGAPVKQFVVGDAKVRGIDWVGDEAILLRRTETDTVAYGTGQNKGEWARANVLPLDDNRDVVSIFAEQRSIANFVAGFDGIREVEGRWKGFFRGYRMGRRSGEDRILHFRPALFSVDLSTGEAEQVAYPAGENEFRSWLVGDEGKIVATLFIDQKSGSWRIENEGGKTIVRDKQEEGRISLVGLDASGSSLIYRSYDDDLAETTYLTLPLAGGEPREVWADEEVHRLIHGDDGRVLGIVSRSREVMLSEGQENPALSELYAKWTAGDIDLESWTPDLSAVVFATSGNYDSGTWYRMDTTSGTRAMLGLERPFVQGLAIGKIQTVEFEASDGLTIEAILTLPSGKEAKDLPVVVLPHGGPTSRDEEAFDWWAQAFASRGYAVIQPNFRGSTNLDDSFVEAGDGEWGGKMQTDIGDSLRALAERGIVDADRACIVGASYGGYSALAGVTIHQNGYRCAVGVNGVYDIEDFFRYELSGQSSILSRGIERLVGEGTNLDAISPTAQASKASAPVLLVHGRDDTVVPFAQSVLMEDALQDAGKPVTLIELKGEDHWLSQADSRTAMLKAAVAFVEKHNPAD